MFSFEDSQNQDEQKFCAWVGEIPGRPLTPYRLARKPTMRGLAQCPVGKTRRQALSMRAAVTIEGRTTWAGYAARDTR